MKLPPVSWTRAHTAPSGHHWSRRLEVQYSAQLASGDRDLELRYFATE